jgi:hypothetical protein
MQELWHYSGTSGLRWSEQRAEKKVTEIVPFKKEQLTHNDLSSIDKALIHKKVIELSSTKVLLSTYILTKPAFPLCAIFF